MTIHWQESVELGDHSVSTFMVFDVESVGLHGESFAVSWCLVQAASEGRWTATLPHLVWCKPTGLRGSLKSHEWVEENIAWRDWWTDEDNDLVLKATGIDISIFMRQVSSPDRVRAAFWRAWMEVSRPTFHRPAYLVADCAWPVEARFLAACVDDSHAAREWLGPYPLLDLASLRMCALGDPMAKDHRLPDEQPAHDPRADVRQSVRHLAEYLTRVGWKP